MYALIIMIQLYNNSLHKTHMIHMIKDNVGSLLLKNKKVILTKEASG